MLDRNLLLETTESSSFKTENRLLTGWKVGRNGVEERGLSSPDGFKSMSTKPKDWSSTKPMGRPSKDWASLTKSSFAGMKISTPSSSSFKMSTTSKMSGSDWSHMTTGLSSKPAINLQIQNNNIHNFSLNNPGRSTVLPESSLARSRSALLRPNSSQEIGMKTTTGLIPQDKGLRKEVDLGEEKETGSGQFPIYHFKDTVDAETEADTQTRTRRDAEIAVHVEVGNQKDGLIKAVSLICGEGAKQLRDPDSNLRQTLENSLSRLLETDPEFILKVSLYARRYLNLRAVSNFILAYAATRKEVSGFLKKYFSASIRLPSEWLEVANLIIRMNTNLAKGNIPAALRRVMVEKFSDFDEYQLAKYNRKPKKVNVEGGEEDDPREHDFSIKRLVRTLHISKPADMVMKILGKKYPENREEFRECRLEGLFRPELAGKRMKLETPETWETQIALKGNKCEVWESLIQHRKLPYTATIRNIRNLLLAGISDKCLGQVASFISNENMIEKGGMFPFQYFTAYEILAELEAKKTDKRTNDKEKDKEPWQKKKEAAMAGRMKNLNLAALKKLKTSLDTAVNVAARVNVPPLKGRSVILCAYGADGEVRMTAAKGLSKKGTTVRETCLLYSVMVASRAEHPTLALFADKYTEVELEKTDLLLNLDLVSNRENIKGTIAKQQTSTDSVIGLIEEYIQQGTSVDNIIVFHSGLQTTSELLRVLDIYREEINPEMMFSSIDVSGTKQALQDGDGKSADNTAESADNTAESADSTAESADNSPRGNHRNSFLAGSSDSMLRFLINNGNGNMIQEVDNIDKKFSLESVSAGQSLPPPSSPVPSFPQWKHVKIFVSSTFLDMQGERNLLHSYVLPILQQKCNSLNVKVDLVDLRWGLLEDDQGPVGIAHCLQQAKEADFFIGILGERYGWVPTRTQKQAAKHLVGGYSWNDMMRYDNASITEMEITEAVLKRIPEFRDRAFFYFRDPAFLDTLPDCTAELFCPTGVFSEDEANSLAKLKQTIKETGIEVMDGYGAVYGGRVKGTHIAANLQEFGDRVLHNLYNSIRKLNPPTDTTTTNNIQAVQAQQLSDCSETAESFVGRTKEIKIIQKCLEKSFDAKNSCGNIVRLVASPGSGCASLLKYTAHMYRNAGMKVVAYVKDERNLDSTVREFLQYLLYSLEAKPIKDSGLEDMCQSVHQKLQKCTGKLLIVVNRLDVIGSVNWIPDPLPPGLTILTSCSGEGKSCLRGREGITDIKIGFMDLKDRSDYLRLKLSKVGKKLEEGPFTNQLKDIVYKKDGGSPGFLDHVVNRLVRQAQFDTLSQDILSAGSSMQEIYLNQIQSAQQNFGENVVATVLRIIFFSKHGISRSDLLSVMSFILYGEVKNVSTVDKTVHLLHEFSSKTECVFSTLELMSLLTELEGVVELASNRYTIPAGVLKKTISEKFVRKALHEKLHCIHVTLAAFYLRSYRLGSTDPNTLKSLGHHIGVVEDGKLLKQILCSVNFCQKMCVGGLCVEYLDLLQGSSVPLKRSREKFVNQPLVSSWIKFVMENKNTLEANPRLVTQLLMNQPKNSLLFEHFLESKELGSGSAKLVEWVNRPTEDQVPSRTILRKSSKHPSVLLMHERFIFLGYSDGTISVLSAETYREGVSFIGHKDEITGLALGSSDTLLSVSADGRVSSWDLRKKIRLQNVQAHTGRCTGISAKNYNIVTAGWDGYINLWSKGLVRLSQIRVGHMPLNAVLLHPFKNIAIVAAWDKSIRIFDLDSKEQKGKLKSNSSVQVLALSDDAAKLAVGTLNGEIEIWDSKLGVQVSSISVGWKVTSLEFSEGSTLLVGTANGTIVGLNYNEGAKKKSPADPLNIKMAPSLQTTSDPEKLVDPTSLRRMVAALCILPAPDGGKSFIVGFDNGDVQWYMNKDDQKLQLGWKCGEDPIINIGYKSDFELTEELDWGAQIFKQDESAVFVHSNNRAEVYSLDQRLSVDLLDIQDRIVNIFLVHGFKNSITVLTEWSVLVYSADIFKAGDNNMHRAVRPNKQFSLGINQPLVKIVEKVERVECVEGVLLGVFGDGDIWTIDTGNGEPSVNFTGLTTPSSDNTVVDIVSKSISTKKGKVGVCFVFCSRGTILKIGFDVHKLASVLDTFTVNTSGIIRVHSDKNSSCIGLVHSCGVVTLWSTQGIAMGSYEGRHTGAWVFNDLLYTGAEDLEVFDPAKPNINIVESGHIGGVTSLVCLPGEGLSFLSAAEDKTIKLWNKPRDRATARLSSLVGLEPYTGPGGTPHLFTLSATGLVALLRVQEEGSIQEVTTHQLDEEPVYIGLRYACLPAGPAGGRLVVFSRTTTTVLGIEAETITHLAEIPQAETTLRLTSFHIRMDCVWQVNTSIVSIGVVTTKDSCGFVRNLRFSADEIAHRSESVDQCKVAQNIAGLSTDDILAIKNRTKICDGLIVFGDYVVQAVQHKIKLYHHNQKGLYQVGEFAGAGQPMTCLTEVGGNLYAGDSANNIYQLRVIN